MVIGVLSNAYSSEGPVDDSGGIGTEFVEKLRCRVTPTIADYLPDFDPTLLRLGATGKLLDGFCNGFPFVAVVLRVQITGNHTLSDSGVAGTSNDANGVFGK